MKSNLIDKFDNQLKGRFEIDFIDKETDEVIDTYTENNIIVNYSKHCIVNLVGGATQNDYMVRYIHLGDDVGTGNAFVPQEPEATYTIDNLDTIYESLGLEVYYPTTESVMFNINIDGNAIVDASNVKYGLSGDTADIMSSTLVTGNGSSFAYKRFPVKVITRFIYLNVRWTLEY